MSNEVRELEPKLLWEHFYQISQIPRCSKDEEAVRQYVISVAKRNGLSYKEDAVKNIVITKPATPGKEKLPIAVLQSHVDMVCEKNKDTVHDFTKDPIKLLKVDDWVKADGTTLGSDNGIGVAAALAVLESKNIAHGALEFLFTIDEETGLTGAIQLGEDMLDGRILINMDSEEDGDIYIGCAGGRDTELFFDIKTNSMPNGYIPVKVRVGGLQGGHSGLQIDAGLGNAIKLMGRFLNDATQNLAARLMHIDGGSKHNAIPRECDAIIAINPKRMTKLNKLAKKYSQIFQDELQLTDGNVAVSVIEDVKNAPKNVFAKSMQNNVLNGINALPHGVKAMSFAVPGLVETSNNVAVIKTYEKQVGILTSQRSSVGSGLDMIANEIYSVGNLAASSVRQGNGYPAWQPNPNSKLLKTAKRIYKDLFGEEIHVKAIHAGLECGIIGDKFPGMDMISFGPTILGAHSPDERVQVSAVDKFWKYLVRILENL